MVAVVPDVKFVKAKRTKLFCATRAFVRDNLAGFLAYQQHMPFHVGFLVHLKSSILSLALLGVLLVKAQTARPLLRVVVPLATAGVHLVDIEVALVDAAAGVIVFLKLVVAHVALQILNAVFLDAVLAIRRLVLGPVR